MSAPHYRPGSWFAVVGPRAVVLLDESISPSRLQAIWNAGNGNPTLDELIEGVTGGRFAGAPLFGIAVLDGSRVRIVVRAGVTAVVGESIGLPRSVVGGQADAWAEEVLDELQSVRLIRDAGSAATFTLPVTGGIVFADEVTWTPSRTLSSVPAGGVTPVEVGPGTGDSEWSVWALDDAGELAGAVGEPVADLEPVELSDRVTVDPGRELPPLLPEAWPESPFDPPLEPRFRPFEPEPQSQPLRQFEPESQPQLLRPYEPEDQPQLLRPFEPETQYQSAVEPETQYQSAVEGLPLEEASVDIVGHLHFSTGQVVPLDRPVIVGRAPSLDRAQRLDRPRLVKLDNLDQDISRNHVEIRVEGAHVVAVDLNSANGTLVTIPGQPAQRLVPQQPFLMLPGSVITLSDEINFSYQDTD